MRGKTHSDPPSQGLGTWELRLYSPTSPVSWPRFHGRSPGPCQSPGLPAGSCLGRGRRAASGKWDPVWGHRGQTIPPREAGAFLGRGLCIHWRGSDMSQSLPHLPPTHSPLKHLGLLLWSTLHPVPGLATLPRRGPRGTEQRRDNGMTRAQVAALRHLGPTAGSGC